MKIMVCDTSNSSCCCGIYDVSEPCGLASELKENAYELSYEKRTHSEVFMPLVHRVVEQAGVTHADIDAYVTTVGPGSFTGIRIGLSAVKGMALAAKKPCIPVSSTRALSYSVENVAFERENTILIPCFDARNNRVFAQVIGDWDKSVLIEENAYDADELASRIAEHEVVKSAPAARKYIAVGNGANTVVAALEKVGIDCENAAGAVIHPWGIARAACEYLESDQPVSGAEITASYCAQSSAERYKK